MSYPKVRLVQAEIIEKTATIANGAATSSEIDTEGMMVVYVEQPATVAGTAFTFTGCNATGGTFLACYDETKTAISLTKTASTAERIGLPAAKSQMFPRFVKAVSSGNSTGISTITIGLRPY